MPSERPASASAASADGVAARAPPHHCSAVSRRRLPRSRRPRDASSSRGSAAAERRRPVDRRVPDLARLPQPSWSPPPATTPPPTPVPSAKHPPRRTRAAPSRDSASLNARASFISVSGGRAPPHGPRPERRPVAAPGPDEGATSALSRTCPGTGRPAVPTPRPRPRAPRELAELRDIASADVDGSR